MNEHTTTILMLVIIGIIYFTPTVVAFARDLPQKQMMGVLNIVMGWTLIGWLVLFFWASLAGTRMEEGFS